ncbi:superfamily II DNA or RNA helicase [Pseudoclavibacter chungangensis]|uniref:helicase-related protein n=1 Tax=Pseudoclavibacter chungangensis TaxID=587635 RepID=UPI0017FC032D|nr:helicase-related protein [Pseudoclavibacter chungangensis]NYJ67528.1 superfamily II DNA or RNA helicase [Pseudoclavibacter chungangensis]
MSLVPAPAVSSRLENVAPGSVVVVRDADWIVTSTAETTSGTLVRVVGLSELVRDTTAAFYSDIDTITPLDPQNARVVADGSSQYRTAKLWLEATMRKSPVPAMAEGLAVADRMLMDPLDYQRAAVTRALDPSNLRPRILLADAVGLGKTLEIGMILAELVRRGRGERILVVTPRHVLEQMQHELWTRFALPFVRLDSVGIQRVRQHLPVTRNPFSLFKRAIISIDTLKQDKYRAHLRKHRWDAVVIDESHNITGKTLNNQLARTLAPNTEALILASATPHNGKPESFAELIRLLEPTAVRPNGDIDMDEARRLVIRRHRNSPEVRGEVGDNWAERLEPIHRLVDASPEENAIADELAEVWLHPADARSPYSGSNSTLFPWTLAKSFLSSPAALRETVTERMKRLDRTGGEAAAIEHRALAHLLDLTNAALEGRSAKYDALLDELRRIGVGKRSAERAVVFSERVPTLGWLAAKLRADLGMNDEQVRVLHGQLSDQEQQEIVEQFKQSSSKIRVLVTGDVASEGVNLHAQCHELIHFDIPWSLIRIEQRNGRIDRYGQRHRPQITTLLLDPANARFAGDVRVLRRVLDREQEAHTTLGDAASLMGRYDVGEEEDGIRRVLSGERELDEIVPNVEDALAASDDPFLALLAGLEVGSALDQRADAALASGTSESSTPSRQAGNHSDGVTGLFAADRDFLRTALAESFTTPDAPVEQNGAGWKELDPSLVELEPPRDLRRRLDVLPQSYLADRGVATRFRLVTERALATQLLVDARDDPKSHTMWPEAHYLGPLHPVLDWAGDRALGTLGRNEVFAVRGTVDMPTVLVQATLTNHRGQLVSSIVLTATVPDPTGDFALPRPVASVREALEDLGFTRETVVNPGPIDAEAFAGVIAPAVHAARNYALAVHEDANRSVTALIDRWSGRVEGWSDEAAGLSQIEALKARRVSVENELEIARSMLPEQTFVRPLLVVVPALTPVATPVGTERSEA